MDDTVYINEHIRFNHGKWEAKTGNKCVQALLSQCYQDNDEGVL